MPQGECNDGAPRRTRQPRCFLFRGSGRFLLQGRLKKQGHRKFTNLPVAVVNRGASVIRWSWRAITDASESATQDVMNVEKDAHTPHDNKGQASPSPRAELLNPWASERGAPTRPVHAPNGQCTSLPACSGKPTPAGVRSPMKPTRFSVASREEVTIRVPGGAVAK